MNFSEEAKKQLCGAEIKSGCALPLLSAIVHTCAVVCRSGNDTELRLTSSNQGLHSLSAYLFKTLFAVGGEGDEESIVREGRDTVIKRGAFRALKELRIMTENDGTVEFVRGIDPYLIRRDKYRRAYLEGAFLGSGSLSADSWHLEISVTGEDYATALSELISGYSLSPHCFKRKERYVVYLKKREEICDFMALIGAMKVSLELSGKLAVNKTKTDAHRSVNLMLSNMDRTISVGVRQAAAIRRIEQSAGLDSLGEKLREVALLRLEDEALSYDDIAARLGISKGSVKYRFKMIMEIAGDEMSGGKKKKEK